MAGSSDSDKTREDLIGLVRGLELSTFEITSERAEYYNCSAWAADDQDRWWWPIGGYWPEGVEERETQEAFEAAYSTLGYVRCAGPEFEDGIEKIAIYALRGTPTHAARQLPSGFWTSKLGALEDVSHPIDGLKVEIYGVPSFFMKRPRH